MEKNHIGVSRKLRNQYKKIPKILPKKVTKSFNGTSYIFMHIHIQRSHQRNWRIIFNGTMFIEFGKQLSKKKKKQGFLNESLKAFYPWLVLIKSTTKYIAEKNLMYFILKETLKKFQKKLILFKLIAKTFSKEMPNSILRTNILYEQHHHQWWSIIFHVS